MKVVKYLILFVSILGCFTIMTGQTNKFNKLDRRNQNKIGIDSRGRGINYLINKENRVDKQIINLENELKRLKQEQSDIRKSIKEKIDAEMQKSTESNKERITELKKMKQDLEKKWKES